MLLVDEVLAVGDAAFQQKCFEEFQRLKDAGRTIVFVTHDMGAVERFCDRAMLIERGQVLSIGAAARDRPAYNELNFGAARARRAERATASQRAGRDHGRAVVRGRAARP